MKITLAIVSGLAIVVLILAVMFLLDRRADRAEWQRLSALHPKSPARFLPEMVSGLPEPARRYFAYAIAPGTPLLSVAEIDMTGRFGLGTKEDPRYRPMQARQVLAVPEGFVWIMKTIGGIPVSGSDSGLWTRFRLLGLVPVARAGGDPDHARSAFGRYISEAVIWTPSALLPGPNVSWSEVDRDTARVTVRRGALSQPVDVTVTAEGQPRVVSLQRWTNANADKIYRLQPFGAVVSDFRAVGGYRLPFHAEAGNMFGTDDYFPFFVADVMQIRFPGGEP